MRPLGASTLFSLLSLFALFSCSKKDGSSQTPAPVKYSTRLSKVYELDTTMQAPNDTISRRFFTYDNFDRIVVDSMIKVEGANRISYTMLHKIRYNGSDTFAAESILKWYATSSGTTSSSDTTYFTFENGYYKADTVLYDYGTNSPRGSSKSTYSYSPGVVIRNFQNWVPQWAYSYTEKDTIYQTIVNGDITHQNYTLHSSANGQPPFLPELYESTISYLPNPNPFYPIFRPFSKRYVSTFGIGNASNTSYAPAHLIAQQTDIPSNTVSYTYVFRPDGYPVSAIMTQDQNGTRTTTKLVFVYAAQ